MQLATMDQLLDAPAVAKLLNVSRRTFEKLMAQGEGPPCLRIGRQRRWYGVDVENWVKGRVVTHHTDREKEGHT